MTDEQLIEAKSIIESLPNDLIKGYIIAHLGLIDVFKSLNLNHKVVYNQKLYLQITLILIIYKTITSLEHLSAKKLR